MKRWHFLLVVVSLSQVTPASAQLPPEKALKTFKVSEGLEISLWAAEPMLVNPTCMDIDHKGRVWVCESVNYRQKLRGMKKLHRPEGDRILVLEDTKGAGKADKVTVFYQAPDIIAPLGIACAPYPDGKGMKVYVCHSPHIYVFEDKDGDLKADGPPKILLTGFGGYDHDHGVHGILIGPDNKLYFSVGDTGVKNLQSSDGKGRKWTSNSTDCRAGTIWRCDLDGKNLELLAHNFRNNYEPCVDSFGSIFISDNDDDGSDQTRIVYVMPGGNYGYHPRGAGQTHWHEEQPGIVPKVLRTGRGSPCGMCFYEGTLLPKKYWGQPLHVDAGPGRLSCYHLKPKGAGYEVEREDMVTSTDSYFRPSDVCVAPDGSVFISDWYDQGVGGHNVRNLEDGRIYRVAPVPPRGKSAQPAFDLRSNEGLLAALGSSALSIRYMAMAELNRMKPSQAVEFLLPAMGQKENPALRSRALWRTIDIIARNIDHPFPAGVRPVIGKIAEDDDYRIRMALMRAAMDSGQLPIPTDASVSETVMLRNAPVSLYRETLLLVRNQHPLKVGTVIRELAKQYDGKDRFYLAAIGIAVGHPGIDAATDKRRDIILADFDKHFPEWNDKVAGLVWELRPPGMVAMLQKRLGNKKLTAAQRSQIVDLLADAADATAAAPAILQALGRENLSEVRDHILAHLRLHLPGKWKNLRKNPDLDKLIVQLLEDDARKTTGLALAAATENPDWLPLILLSARAKEPPAVRLAAAQALAAFRDDKFAIDALRVLAVNPTNPQQLRLEAVAGLARHNTTKAREILRELTGDAEVELPERQAAIAGLSASKDGAAWLLQAHTAKKLNADLTPDLARLLRHSPYPDIKKQAEKILPAPPKLDPKKLPSIPALLARKGNPVRGEQVLLATLKNDAQCLKCHIVRGVGSHVGPDLSTIGAKASRENLLESILYPSRAISHQFEAWVVETKQGLAVTGLIMEDAPDFFVLRDATGKDFKIAKKDVETKAKSPVSLMPDNLIPHLPEADLVDLVEYLYGLKNLPPGATSRLDRELHPRTVHLARSEKRFFLP